MKTIKLNKGFYSLDWKGQKFQIVLMNTDVKDKNFWMIQTISVLGNWIDLCIEFTTKTECLNYIKDNY